MKFYIVDAFADAVFGGNPAGVVLLGEGCDFPDSDTMVKTAAELRYSETAFVRRTGVSKWEIRYFTPTSEVELCGHATIGTFSALLQSGHISEGQHTVHTRAGVIGVSATVGGMIFMDMAAPELIKVIDDPDEITELYGIIGSDISCQLSKGLIMLPRIISTGLPDIMLPVADRSELDAMVPDFAALAGLSRKLGVVGVHAFTVDHAPGAVCHARNFAPLYGIDEEAATGTASGALTYYGYLEGFIKPGDSCVFIQGEKLGRPSKIHTNICLGDDSLQIQVGGTGKVVAAGEIYL